VGGVVDETPPYSGDGVEAAGGLLQNCEDKAPPFGAETSSRAGGELRR
jgi:hypothetical protein